MATEKRKQAKDLDPSGPLYEVAEVARRFEESAASYARNGWKRRIINSIVRPRRTHLYCVGLPKSGTHSLAAMFEDRYRARHEPQLSYISWLKSEHRAGRIDDAALRRYLNHRDLVLWLELESSAGLGVLTPHLVALRPGARFILTWREPMGWIRSWTNHVLNRPYGPTSIWTLNRAQEYRPATLEWSPHEEALRARGLYPIAGYLEYWARHVRTVLDAVPRERLLVLRVDQIRSRIAEVARFAGVPEPTLLHEEAHAFKGLGDQGVIAQVDPGFLAAEVERCCRTELDRLTAFG